MKSEKERISQKMKKKKVWRITHILNTKKKESLAIPGRFLSVFGVEDILQSQ